MQGIAIGHILDGRYKIVQTLGTGGFGHTYIAEDLRIPGNPKCVVKHLKPISNDPNVLTTARRLFHSEAESLAQLGNHDQIPRILAFFEEDREFFLVQEFIEGHSLAEELTPGKRLSESYAIALLEGLLPVLEFIHRQDVIHRDIKPANIIRRKQDSKLVLIDFGAVKQVRAVASAFPNEISNVTVAVGTPGYMPTEQRLGRPRANSDIYALGAIAIQSLVGMYPNNLPEDLQTGELVWQNRATVSPGIADLLNRMVREHFQDRFQSAPEVWQALSQLKGSASIPTVLPNRPVCPPTEAVPQAEENSVGSMPGCELTLEWVEAGQRRTYVIRDRQPSKYPGTFRIGRDPAQCDLVLSDPSISGLHAEIFYNPQQHCFYVRSLRESNPPVINGMALPSGEAMLDRGSTLQLGQLDLRAIDVTVQLSPGGYAPPPYNPPAPPQIEPPQSLAPTLPPPTPPASEPIAAPVPPPPPPASEPIAAPAPPPPPPEPPRTASPNKLAWIAGAIAIGLLAGGAPFALSFLNASKQCEATIIANDNIRTEPTADFTDNIIQEFSGRNLEQKFPVTGTKTIEENGKFWVQLNLPSQRLAYAHNTVIANYAEIESCLKKSGKSFAIVRPESLIASRPAATSNSEAQTRKPPQSSKPAKSSSVPDNKEGSDNSDDKKTASYQQGLNAGQTRGRELGKTDGEANGGQGAMHLEASCGDGAINTVSTNPDYLKGYKQGCEQAYREAFQSAREAINKQTTTDNPDGQTPPICGDGKPAEFTEGQGYSCSGGNNNPETPSNNPPSPTESPSPENSPSPASS